MDNLYWVKFRQHNSLLSMKECGFIKPSGWSFDPLKIKSNVCLRQLFLIWYLLHVLGSQRPTSRTSLAGNLGTCSPKRVEDHLACGRPISRKVSRWNERWNYITKENEKGELINFSILPVKEKKKQRDHFANQDSPRVGENRNWSFKYSEIENCAFLLC